MPAVGAENWLTTASQAPLRPSASRKPEASARPGRVVWCGLRESLPLDGSPRNFGTEHGGRVSEYLHLLGPDNGRWWPTDACERCRSGAMTGPAPKHETENGRALPLQRFRHRESIHLVGEAGPRPSVLPPAHHQAGLETTTAEGRANLMKKREERVREWVETSGRAGDRRTGG